MSETFLIYKHTAPSGKAYIGQTNNLHRRNICHRNTAGCRAFAAAIKKYGWDAFTHEVLIDGLTLDEANRLEQEMIALHNTMSPNGYNIRTGGLNGKPSAESVKRSADARRGKALTDEHRKFLSEYWKNQPAERFEKLFAAARNKSPETRAKISLGNTGKVRSDELKAQISNKLKLTLNNPEVRKRMSDARKGKRHSDETKAKQAEAARKRWSERRENGTNKEAPEVTAKRAAALRETWRRKKEAAQGDLF